MNRDTHIDLYPARSLAAPMMRRQSVAPHPATSGLPAIIAAVLATILTVSSGEWTLGLGIVVFVIGWRYLARNERTPAAAAAFSYQWLQVTIAILYVAMTGHKITWMSWSHWQPMVILGLASISAMFFGYYLTSPARRQVRAPGTTRDPRLAHLVISYAIAIALSAALRSFAYSIPGLTQMLLVLSIARYAILFMLVSRLLDPVPHWMWVIAILLLEMTLGFSGYFANFREPLAFVGLAVVGAMSRQRTSSVFALSLIVILGFGAAVTWTAIKPIVRERYSSNNSTTERLKVAVDAIAPALKARQGGWQTQVDVMVSRMWVVYYPSLALERVPSIVPFEHGKLLWDAISNIINPRFFFPAKGELSSDSEKVRKYTGIMVAGRETQTSFAFGYAAESYVDFGIPLMFLPIFIFGLLVGCGDRLLCWILRSDAVRQGVRVAFLWSALYLFETSWAMMLGIAMGTLVVLGSAGLFYESLLGLRSGNQVTPDRTLS